MAELLHRLGRFSARRAWLVITAWALALALAAGGYLAFGGTLSSAVTIPGTETVRVADQLAKEFPAASGGTATVVLRTQDGSEFTPSQRAAVAELLDEVAGMDGVRETVDPFAVRDQMTAGADEIATGQADLDRGLRRLERNEARLAAGRDALESAQEQLDAARAQGQLPAAQLDAQQDELDARMAQLTDGEKRLEDGRAELEDGQSRLDDARTVLEHSRSVRQVSANGSTALAAVVFHDPVIEVDPDEKDAVADRLADADLPGVEVDLSNELVQAIPSVFGVGEAVGLAIAAITLFVMLGTLVGAGLPLVNALVGVGVGVAGSMALSGAVDMMSVTPVLGVMLGLAVGIDYSLFIIHRHRTQMRAGMDLVDSIALANGTSGNAVAFAGATVVTALAALNVTGIGFLGLMGTVGAICVVVAVLVAITLTPALLRLVGHRIVPRRQRGRVVPLSHSSSGVRPMRTGRAVLQVLVGVGVLVTLALPALDMRLGLPDGASEPQDSTAYRAFKTIESEFGPGFNGPLLMVVEHEEPLDERTALHEQARVADIVAARNGVEAVAPIGLSENGRFTAFQVVGVEGPNGERTQDLVHTLRGIGPHLSLRGPDVSVGVAGNASGNIDISEKLADSLPGYLALVVGLSLVIMALVFRSVLVPVTAALGFVLSLLATFGALTAIFQWGWLSGVFGIHEPGPILSFLPTIVIGILFGLAMDYQLFLVSGMRESYVHGASSRVAVQHGMRAGRTVVVAAAIIMISVFAGFIFSHTAMIRSLGFGLAFGVLVDAFLVRMLVIPGVMHLLGDAAWWLPRWLDRLLPDVDVEGAALERNHPSEAIEVDADDPTRA